MQVWPVINVTTTWSIIVVTIVPAESLEAVKETRAS
jgi:hypothetical protein